MFLTGLWFESDLRKDNNYFCTVSMASGNDLVPGSATEVLPSRSDHRIGGSMLVGRNDPDWFGAIGGDPAFPNGLQVFSVWFGASLLWAVPSGARFDPFGPPGFDPDRFAT
ncbi:hypothetical protein Fmac_010979 [Flemingia macrophylla]|uniref:Chlorophyll a-b binding protein, chloroplastic n=1 Tax=Flemingia macrophylla TaxID=520843 RepID=A0ABD1ML58_9FABA